MHALIIEDEPLIAMLIEDGLRSCGFTSFDFAVSHEEAVASAELRCPRLITADVELNPGSGIDAVEEICGGPTIPVIFVTGSPQPVSERMPQHLLLFKPFNTEKLIAIAKIALASVETPQQN